jgi:hypothetical protein
MKIADLGKHAGSWGDGHYEAEVTINGNVKVVTVYDNAPQTNTVTLSPDEWDRLVAFVNWQRAEAKHIDAIVAGA